MNTATANKTKKELQAENEALAQRLQDAEDALAAIRAGAVDAFIVQDGGESRVFTLETADRPYRVLVENMQQAAVTLQADGTICYCNGRLAELLQIAQENLPGARLSDFVAPGERAAFEDSLQAAAAGTVQRECNFHKSNGKAVPAYLTVHSLPSRGPASLCALITDLTAARFEEERQRASAELARRLTELEKANTEIRAARSAALNLMADVTRANTALRDSEQQLRAVNDNTSELIFMKDTEGRFTYANAATLRLVGRTREQATGAPDKTLFFNPSEHAAIAANDRRVVETGQTVVAEEPFTSADGAQRILFSTKSPLRNERGEVIGIIVVSRDITERKQAEKALQGAHAQLADRAVHLEALVEERTVQLRETIAELESFSYSIAHDMRAPLRAMQGFSKLLQEDYGDKLDDEGRDFLRKLGSSASRMDALIQDVLNYSKISRAEMRLEPIDAKALLTEIVEAYPQLQGHKDVIRIEPGVPVVLANRAALTQVFSNLLANAVKFVKPGGSPFVNVSTENRGGGVIRIWFEDNGIGIRPEDQERIFMMFQRLNPAKEYEGTGIGLTIVRKAVERMGGRVGVESAPGKGSRFWIELKTPSEASP